MNFLEKLYSNSYFAPVLFGVIAVLAVLFVIVLIMALKDAKKRNGEETKVDDTLSKVEEEPKDLSIEMTDTKEDNNEEVEDKLSATDVISSLVPENDSFENISISAPSEDQEIELKAEEEDPFNGIVTLNEDNTTSVEVEPSDVAIVDEVAQAESDLDAIAKTLLAEYRKEMPKVNKQVEETPSQSDQYSSVFVTPNTLSSDDNTPNLFDIPTPQPVRVVDQSTIIDSSNRTNNVDINNISNEEYTIK